MNHDNSSNTNCHENGSNLRNIGLELRFIKLVNNTVKL